MILQRTRCGRRITSRSFSGDIIRPAGLGAEIWLMPTRGGKRENRELRGSSFINLQLMVAAALLTQGLCCSMTTVPKSDAQRKLTHAALMEFIQPFKQNSSFFSKLDSQHSTQLMINEQTCSQQKTQRERCPPPGVTFSGFKSML